MATNSQFNKMNELDYRIFKNYENDLKPIVSSLKHVGMELAYAIGSRESNWGRTLKNNWGDNGNAYGIFQVDKRFHQQHINSGECEVFSKHAKYALNLLEANIKYFIKKYPNDGDINFVRGICAYNAGCGGVDSRAVKKGLHPDVATTGKNYGTDVLNRAKWFSEHSDTQRG